MNILFLYLPIPKTMLLATIPSFLIVTVVFVMSVIWLVAYTIDRRKKSPNYRGHFTAFHDNEYADERFLGI